MAQTSAAREEGKIYKVGVRTVITYGLKTVSTNKETEGRVGGGRAADDKIYVGSDQEGQN